MMDYLDLAKDALFALTEGGFLFPVLTYGAALMSAAALLLTLAHLLPLTSKSATRWAAVAVWGLVALAAGGAQLIAGDDLKAAFDLGLEAAEHTKVTQHKTLLMWAWAAPLPAVLLILLAAAPKSAGARTTGLVLSVLLGAGACVYALTLVHAHQRTANMSYEITVDMQTNLPEAWRKRLEETTPTASDEAVEGEDAAGSTDSATDDVAADAQSAAEEPRDEPVRFFGLPVE